MAAERAVLGGRPLLSGSCAVYFAMRSTSTSPLHALLSPMVQQNDNTSLRPPVPSSDTLRAMAVKWMFLGCYESPFLHCSKVLQKVKQQAWSMGEHHVIVRVQLKDALDRDDVIDMSTHEAQVRHHRHNQVHRHRYVPPSSPPSYSSPSPFWLKPFSPLRPGFGDQPR